MNKSFSIKKLNILFSLLSVLAVFVVWIIAYFCVANEYVIASPISSLVFLFSLYKDAFFWKSLLWTLLRVIVAFFICLCLGALIAVISSVFKSANYFLKPIITIIRTLPTAAIVLIILIMTMTNRRVTPIYVTMLVMLPLLTSTIYSAIMQVDSGLMDMARVYNLSRMQIIAKIYIPTALPYFLNQVGHIFSFGVKVMISAEILCGTKTSIGGLIQASSSFVEMPALFAYTIVAVIIGIVAELLCALIYKLLVRRARSV